MSHFFALIRQSLGGLGASPASRQVAKERLSIMLVHQRNNEIFGAIDMDALQKEVAAVVRKYINVKQDKAPNMLGEFGFKNL